jgi:hypothetical protein
MGSWVAGPVMGSSLSVADFPRCWSLALARCDCLGNVAVGTLETLDLIVDPGARTISILAGSRYHGPGEAI